MRFTNNECQAEARGRRLFSNKNHTLFGGRQGDRFIVYSYGVHFPLYVWDDGQWYENEDRYSTTTSRHRTQVRPSYNTIKFSTERMKVIAEGGYIALVKWRLKGEKV